MRTFTAGLVLGAAVLLVAVVSPARAQSDCAGGLIYDDGSFENGLRLNAADGRFVQRISLSGPQAVRSVCVCWISQGSGDAAINFNLLVYDANGPSGQPGNLVASVPEVATNIPISPASKFYRYDLSGVNLGGDGYVGVQVNGFAEPGIYLCTSDGFAAPREAYASVNGGAFWGSMTGLDPLFEAFGLRAVTGPASGTCVPSATALCLNNNRFKVSATWKTPQGQSGDAQAIPRTSDTGEFWFFSATNIELVVKLLDACSFNPPHFWVFAGGLTSVQVTMTVADTKTGITRTYTNPQGTAFRPIQDVGAFACP